MLLSDVQKSGLLCLMDIAAGMEHLHSMGVLHVRPCLCSVPEPFSHTKFLCQSILEAAARERITSSVFRIHTTPFTHAVVHHLPWPLLSMPCGMPPHMEPKTCPAPYVDSVPHTCVWLHRPDRVCITSLLTLLRDACVQGDLKGANVLLKSTMVSAWDPRGYVCKLADFGLSRVMEHNRTHVSTATFGTAA